MHLGRRSFAQISLGKTAFCSPLLENHSSLLRAVKSFKKSILPLRHPFSNLYHLWNPLPYFGMSIIFLMRNVCSEKHFSVNAKLSLFYAINNLRFCQQLLLEKIFRHFTILVHHEVRGAWRADVRREEWEKEFWNKVRREMATNCVYLFCQGTWWQWYLTGFQSKIQPPHIQPSLPHLG